MAATRWSVRSLARSTERIFAGRQVELPHISVFSNAPEPLQASWRPAYAARVARPSEVSLVLLPDGTEVSGRAGFAARAGECLIAEQLIPGAPADPWETLRVFEAGDPVVEVEAETVLIARFGEGTWGHWLVELLPKLAVAEAAWPGRFRYAVPHWVLQGGFFSDRLFEAMAAYGVTADRLVQVRSDHVMRFSRLFAVTPVYSDDVPHPDAMRVMEDGIRAIPAGPPTPAKVALLRNDARRRMVNGEAVKALLESHGFGVVDIAERSFVEQGKIFAGGQTVFSVLGSSLSGLIFSPPGARVVVTAPERFGDRFFYGILQGKPGAKWAEARGPIAELDPHHERDSSFQVPLSDLERALAAVQA